MSAWLATLFAATGVSVVFVPDVPEHCATQARVASVVDLTDGLRLLRGPLEKDEKLDAARERLAATVAIVARRTEDGVTVEVAHADGVTKKTAPAQGGAPLAEALRAAWPKSAPPLLEARALGVPNDAAIDAACKGDAKAAYDASGAAVGRTIPALIAPDEKRRGGTLLVDWAIASARAAAGDCRRAVSTFDRTIVALERGALAPVWRRAPPSEETLPSSLEVIDDIVTAFEAGAFVAMDLLTGQERWRVEVGAAEPTLVRTRRHLIAATESALIAIVPATGKIAWQHDLPSPAPEIAVRGGRLFVATRQEILGIADDDGEIVWRTDPLVTPVGGPVLVGGELAIPAGPFVLFLDYTSGKELRRIDVGDELAAPLTVTPLGAVWALVGSDEIVQLQPEPPAVLFRTSAFVGAAWPPAVVAEQLVVAATYRRRPAVAYVDPKRPNGIGRILVGALPPIVTLRDYSGVLHRQARPYAIVARDLRGNATWSARTSGEVASLSTHGDVVVGAVKNEAIVLDRKKGTRITSLSFDERIVDVAYEQTGGAALTEAGVLYGLPSGYDPRPAAWLREVRLEAARCRLALGQRTVAQRIAEDVLERDRDNLDAAAILAGASSRTQDVVNAWRTVMTTAPRYDVVQNDAREALAKRIGLSAFVRPAQTITDVAAAGGVLITKEGDAIVARRAADPNKPLWSKKLGAQVESAGPAVRIGKKLWSPTSGKEVKPAAAFDPAVVGATLFLRKDNVVSIADDSGATTWTQTVDDGQKLLDADAKHVLLATDGGLVQVLDRTTGERRFVRNLEVPIVGGHLDQDAAVLVLADALWVLDVTTGEERKKVTRGEEPMRFVTATNRGLVYATDKQVRLFDVVRGRLTTLLSLPEDVEALYVVAADERPIVWAHHGASLTAYDLMRRQFSGRVELGPLAKVVRAEAHIAALESAGVLWVFDGTRALASK
ncbi:MAG: PQQ-binding-like beta-propeller repeat protein [Deltaproteobacteria bacterium]